MKTAELSIFHLNKYLDFENKESVSVREIRDMQKQLIKDEQLYVNCCPACIDIMVERNNLNLDDVEISKKPKVETAKERCLRLIDEKIKVVLKDNWQPFTNTFPRYNEKTLARDSSNIVRGLKLARKILEEEIK